MKFAEKDFKEYWEIIKIPAYILIGWNVLALILAIISFDLYSDIFSSTAGLILSLAIFGFIGWSAIKDHNQSVGHSAWSGALAGIVSGIVGAIISIIMFYAVPDLLLIAASRGGVDPEQIRGFMAIGIYIGLITGPLFSGLIGAAISSLAALIAKKVK